MQILDWSLINNIEAFKNFFGELVIFINIF